MRAFAEAWPDEPIVQAPLAQITWYHNLALLEKVSTPDERLWYAKQTIEHGWSRNVLVYQIESNFFARQGKAITNFDRFLPPPQSDRAVSIRRPGSLLPSVGRLAIGLANRIFYMSGC